jgi:small nuclear ribonucleoprotein (snRNP)-like protein
MDEQEKLKEKVTAFYKKYNPGNLKNLELILQKYAGKEAELFARLRKKYEGSSTPAQQPKNSKPAGKSGAPKVISRESSSGGSSSSSSSRSSGSRSSSSSSSRSSGSGSGNGSGRSSSSSSSSSSSGASSSQIKPKDPGLDFRSADFDPLRALYAKGLQPPMRNVRPLDNISKARILLPAKSEDACHSVTLGKVARKPGSESKSQLEKDKQDGAKTVIDYIAEKVGIGPYTVLLDCFKRKSRICVTIRRVNSIRGTCVGLLVAFDKHMNIVLLDVVERYTIEQRQVGRSGNMETVELPRQRHLKQIFIRGDNVVMVREVAEAGNQHKSQKSQKPRQRTNT